MRRWQKRLSDLQQLLEQCNSTYMEPDLFRLNVNNFLQTARTVTFLIQKEKSSIPEFDRWHMENIAKPWSDDEVMKWAKDSRNKIEKEGDLELNSLAQATLILGHLPETDQVIEFPGQSILFSGTEALVRSAKQILPPDVANSSLIRIERRWVAEALPNHELLYALVVVYSRLHAACLSLTTHVGENWPDSVAPPSKFIDLAPTISQTYWVKLENGKHYMTRKSATDRTRTDDVLTPERKLAIAALSEKLANRTLESIHEWHEEMADLAFRNDGFHLSMLFMYRKDLSMIRMIGTEHADRAEKYMFWRELPLILAAEGAAAFVYIGELWLRQAPLAGDMNIDNLEIVGEQLQLITVAAPGRLLETRWNIVREGKTARLVKTDEGISVAGAEPSFLTLSLRAIGIESLVKEG